jgi:nucleotide-binding universal stress UspA family protein
MRNNEIVVGFDGSDLADLALQWAVDTAAPTRARVEVVVAANVPSSLAAWAPVDNTYLDAMRVVADQAEKRLAELGYSPSCVDFHEGDALPVLVEAAKDAAMLVVGSAGHSALGAGIVGSVSRHLASHATCPLVVVRPALGEHQRIFVGVDGGPSSEAPLRFAFERAARTGAPVTVLHAYDGHDPWRGEIGLPAHPGLDKPEAERVLAEAVAGVVADFPDVRVRRELVPMRPEHALVGASSEAALVVVGARGRNPFARLLLGSVSQHVLHHAQCPVAVVR